jgi:ADP-ribose pyrophosphatase YjhB (NUDIX family)
MSLEVNIHDAQMVILRELLFHPSVGFAKLQKLTDMSSDHFNFHLQKLIELKLVEKLSRGTYTLAPRGKEYANKLDTDNHTVERQPKTTVILVVERKVGKKIEYLFQERLKHPYFGFWGLISGKIRWGETIVQTAERELMEETGLMADFKFAGIYHELAFQKGSNEQLEDKIFFVMYGTNAQGDLKEEFEGGKNSWMSFKDFDVKTNKFKNMDIKIGLVSSAEKFIEKVVEYEKDLF